MTSIRRFTLTLAVAFSLAGLSFAQAPDFEGVERPDAARGRTVRVAGQPASTPPPDAGSYDFLLAVSDKTFNQLIQAVLKNPGQQEPSKSGKKLQALSVAFPRDGYLALNGVYSQPQTAQTKAGTFKFDVVARLAAPKVNVVQLDIVGAQVSLNGAKVFQSDSADTSPIGAVLDFLSPGITTAANVSLQNAETALARRYGQDAANPGARVQDLMTLDQNKIQIKILPGLLSPLFPPVQVTSVKISGGKIEMKANFR